MPASPLIRSIWPSLVAFASACGNQIPTPASTVALPPPDTTWWVLAYRADTSRTSVMLYRLLKDGARFQEVQELAGRDFGRAQFCAGWVGCPRQELAQAGDYVGFAAGWRRLMAAYVLPLGNDPLWRATVYVSRLDLNP